VQRSEFKLLQQTTPDARRTDYILCISYTVKRMAMRGNGTEHWPIRSERKTPAVEQKRGKITSTN